MSMTEDELDLSCKPLRPNQPKPRKRQAKGPIDESLFTTKSFAFSSHMKRIAESEQLASKSEQLALESKYIEQEIVLVPHDDPPLLKEATPEPVASDGRQMGKKKGKARSNSTKRQKKSLRLAAKEAANLHPMLPSAALIESPSRAPIAISSDDEQGDKEPETLMLLSEEETQSSLTNRSAALFHELEAEYFPEAKSSEKSTSSVLVYRQQLALFPPSQLDRYIPPEYLTILSNESFAPSFESFRTRHALPDSLVWAAEAARIYDWASPSSLSMSLPLAPDADGSVERPAFKLYAFMDVATWKFYERQFFSLALSWQDYTLNLEIELAALAQPESFAGAAVASSGGAADSDRHLRLQLRGPQGSGGGAPWTVQIDPSVTTWASVLDSYKAAHASLPTTATHRHSLWFDGEKLELESLIVAAGLENDDCIEVHMAANNSFCK